MLRNIRVVSRNILSNNIKCNFWYLFPELSTVSREHRKCGSSVSALPDLVTSVRVGIELCLVFLLVFAVNSRTWLLLQLLFSSFAIYCLSRSNRACSTQPATFKMLNIFPCLTV
uniref:Uncharacterized protein n=1 Tax=Glossina austeni TaxID=7395 RepID=A0A1A9UDY0_GLOAU